MKIDEITNCFIIGSSIILFIQVKHIFIKLDLESANVVAELMLLRSSRFKMMGISYHYLLGHIPLLSKIFFGEYQ